VKHSKLLFITLPDGFGDFSQLLKMLPAFF
jgi:hypothetical protein